MDNLEDTLDESDVDVNCYTVQYQHQLSESIDVCSQHDGSFSVDSDTFASVLQEPSVNQQFGKTAVLGRYDDSFSVDTDTFDAISPGISAEQSNDKENIIRNGPACRRKTMWTVSSVVNLQCCDSLCLKQLDPSEVVAIHYNHQSDHRTELQKKRMITQYVLNHYNADVGKVDYFLAGFRVCQKAWRMVYDIGQRRLHRYVKKRVNGTLRYINLKTQRRRSERTLHAIAWMTRYFDLATDNHPETGARHLPCHMTKVKVYERYKIEIPRLHLSDITTVSYSQFHLLWKTTFNDVSIPAEDRFAKCDVCAGYQAQLEKLSDADQIKEVQSLLDIHVKFVMDERTLYRERIQDAVSRPDKYASIIIDGMDQSKLDLPRLKIQRKDTSAMYRLRTHLTGVLVHGETSLGFFDLLQYCHDSNLTCSIILATLKHMSRIPPILYIQADNCWRENKNQYVLGFIAWLVQCKVVDEVRLSFLMKGHTHEDIDRTFSNLSKNHLRSQDVLTLPELMEKYEKVLKRAYAPKHDPKVELIGDVFNFKEFIEPFLFKISRHTNPHVFRIYRAGDETVRLSYKKWSQSPDWIPQGEGYYIFKENGIDVPTGFPDFVEPRDDKQDIRKLETDIMSVVQSHLVQVFTEDQQKWWTNFFKDLYPRLLKPTRVQPLFIMHDLLEKRIRPTPLVNVYLREMADAQTHLQNLVPESDQMVIIRGQTTARSATEYHASLDNCLTAGMLLAIATDTAAYPIVVEFINRNENNTLYVRQWDGGFSRPWRAIENYLSIQPQCVVMANIQLSGLSKMNRTTVNELKQLYLELGFE